MKLKLQQRVTLYITAVTVSISLVSAVLFISSHRKSMEKEVIAHGFTMADALSRAVDEGVATENLDLITQVQDIVHAKDVDLAQVYSSLWLPVDAYPSERHNEPPDPAAVEHFNSAENRYTHFYKKEGHFIDFYTPVFYHPIGIARSDDELIIGYVRLRLSTSEYDIGIRQAVFANILASLLMTVIAVIVLNTVIRKYIISPVMDLHASVSMHKEGELPEPIAVKRPDEIGELTAEFNNMIMSVKDREESLSREKERLSVTLRSIGDGVIVTDTEGRITLLNRVAETCTGWTAQEAVGRSLAEVFNIINEQTREACENPVEKVMDTGLIVGLANHTALVRRDGTEIIIEDSAAPIMDRHSEIIGVVLVFRDATEKHKLEDELQKIEKLQSVGLLAGGLAHDFNNLLTSIIGNISLAKIFVEPGNRAYDRLSDAEIASFRATDLTRQLLTFAKGGAPVKKTASIVDIVRESLGLSLSGTNVSSEVIVSEDIPPVDVDVGQMNQVFNNLLINSVQAMPNGGKVRITIDVATVQEKDARLLPDGRYVRVSVKDSGIGIPPENLGSIFDPYFTTKKKGSGLGLASVYSIVKRHDGLVTVESTQGEGATFHVYLPASGKLSADETSGENHIHRGCGRVLVMDDDKIVRETAGEMLRTMGCDVSFAVDGSEAIEAYKKAMASGAPFDLVIMDLTIPGGMGGKDAARELLLLDPKARVIVSSGYSTDPIMGNFEEYGFKGVITKPYNIAGFSKSVREVLRG